MITSGFVRTARLKISIRTLDEMLEKNLTEKLMMFIMKENNKNTERVKTETQAVLNGLEGSEMSKMIIEIYELFETERSTNEIQG